ncbi:hypothetical protein Tco_0604739 [Tanacetum coccineum]
MLRATSTDISLTKSYIPKVSTIPETEGPYSIDLPSPDDIRRLLELERVMVDRTIKSQTVTLTPNQILTKELSPDMKQWEELIRENVFGLGGHRDHLPACLTHMLYCVVAEKQYNLAYFFVKRIECARVTPTANLPCGMFLTRLYRHIMEAYPHLDNGIYDIVDRVMRPLALKKLNDLKISLLLVSWVTSVLHMIGNGYSLKDKNEAKTDKTEHENGKSVKNQNLQIISEELAEYINLLSWNRPAYYYEDDDEEYTIAITPDLPTEEPDNSLIRSDIESECDKPVCEDFTTSSNPLFDSDDDFSSCDDESFSDEDVSKEIYSNPLFDEEIISTKIDPHHFNAESDLIESLLNRDILIISSPKIDSFLEEFSGELAHIDLISPGINETKFDPKEEICLLYDNSSPRPTKEVNSENSNAIIESFSPSPILVEDSDSLMEEIDLFLTPDDSMPPGIKNNDYDSEGDISLKNCLAMILLYFLKMSHFILMRERAAIREAKAKLQMTKYYNARVRGVTFRPGDLVYRSNDASHAVYVARMGALDQSGKDLMRSQKHSEMEHTD